MIKQTFYNLPEHKRQRVINAVVEEFANAESDKVSINHIVQNAVHGSGKDCRLSRSTAPGKHIDGHTNDLRDQHVTQDHPHGCQYTDQEITSAFTGKTDEQR